MAKNTRSNDKYQRILDAAIKVFAEHGFYHSKVAEIAKAADVADGTIYLYFKNKDDILISLFEGKMNEIIAQLDSRLVDVRDPLEKIRIYIAGHFELVRDHHDLAEVITVELRQSTKFMKEYRNVQFTRYLKILADIIQEGQAGGVVAADVSPATMSRALFGMMDELALSLVLSGPRKKQSLDKMVEEISAFVLRGLRPAQSDEGLHGGAGEEGRERL
ncbi:MAG: TetR family transcriptional regulator [Myxococcales bacterium]|nr:MAG: TetR family transcriptional regulator [Myxococcales bacterium]